MVFLSCDILSCRYLFRHMVHMKLDLCMFANSPWAAGKAQSGSSIAGWMGNCFLHHVFSVLIGRSISHFSWSISGFNQSIQQTFIKHVFLFSWGYSCLIFLQLDLQATSFRQLACSYVLELCLICHRCASDLCVCASNHRPCWNRIAFGSHAAAELSSSEFRVTFDLVRPFDISILDKLLTIIIFLALRMSSCLEKFPSS
jgi:hypothetical protein